MSEGMTQKAFEEFRTFALRDPLVQAKLHGIEEQESFVHQVVAVGEEYGFFFTHETVMAAMRANRRAWNGRWNR